MGSSWSSGLLHPNVGQSNSGLCLVLIRTVMVQGGVIFTMLMLEGIIFTMLVSA